MYQLVLWEQFILRLVGPTPLDGRRALSKIPNFGVIRHFQFMVRDVLFGCVSLACQPSRQRGRKLRVDKEAHQPTRGAGWSLDRAAYSSAAVMSYHFIVVEVGDPVLIQFREALADAFAGRIDLALSPRPSNRDIRALAPQSTGMESASCTASGSFSMTVR